MQSNNFSTRVSRQFKEEMTDFSTNGVGKTGIRRERKKERKMEALIIYIKINSKQNKDLNIRDQTIKLLEEIMKEKPQENGLGIDILDMTSNAQKER